MWLGFVHKAQVQQGAATAAAASAAFAGCALLKGWSRNPEQAAGLP
jgi:hypothetical protein